MASEETLLAVGLLNVCKQLLGRVRMLEEVIANHPELGEKLEAQERFKAAFEEDEYNRLQSELKELVTALEGDLDRIEVPPDETAGPEQTGAERDSDSDETDGRFDDHPEQTPDQEAG